MPYSRKVAWLYLGMVLNLWSILLIASASQCLFLILFFLKRGTKNKTATRLLILLLSIILFMNVGNLWYAARIYLEIPWLAGIGRGTTLLIGPAFYLYTLSVIRPGFKLRKTHFLHLSGYVLGLSLVYLQPGGDNMNSEMQKVEAFLMNGIQATPLVLIRFGLYVLHLATYLILSRKEVIRASEKLNDNYLISRESRIKWLSKLNSVLIAIGIVVVLSFIDALVTGYYNSDSNYINTLIYSVFVYLIAYQALADDKEIVPDFKTKYQAGQRIQADKDTLIDTLKKLLREEKIFKNPELKQADIARMLEIPPHQLTALLNTELNQSFFELLNHYRVEEFIALANDEAYDHLSIMGKAQEAGFTSKSSFNTAFKKIKGQTPSEFLKNSH